MHSFFSQSDFYPKWQIFCHASSSNQWLWSPSGLWPSKVSTSHSISLGVLSPEIHDLLTRVLHRLMTMIHFGYSGFRSSKLLPSLLPEVLPPKVHDLLTCFFQDSMTTIHFGFSSFGSFKLLHTHSSQSDFTRRQHISATRPSRSDGPDLLHLLRLPFRASSLLTSGSLATCYLQRMTTIYFGLQNFGSFSHSALEVP
jgi:hypothetical protein